jgi:hypothetical protein
MLHLKEAGIAFGVHVVGNRGSPEADGMLKDLAERGAEAFELGPGKAAGHAAGANAGAKQALVGIDVSHPCQQRLIQKRSLDGEAAAAKKSCECLRGNVERFSAWAEETGMALQVFECETAEATRVYKAQLEAAGEGEAGMGVRREGGGGIGNQQPPGQAAVDDPRRSGQGGGGWSFCRFAARLRRTEFADDVLAGAMNGEKNASHQAADLLFNWSFEGLGMGPEPGVEDAMAPYPPIHTAGYGFYLGKFGHGSIIAGGECETEQK